MRQTKGFGLGHPYHDDSIARVSKSRLHRRKLRDAPVADVRNVATEPLDKNIGELNLIVNGRAGRKDRTCTGQASPERLP